MPGIQHEIGVAEINITSSRRVQILLPFGSQFWGPGSGQKPATPNATSGVAGWQVGRRPGIVHWSGPARIGHQNWTQKWSQKWTPKAGPKIESLFKLRAGIVFGAHFWGPLLGSILGPCFSFFKNYFLNRLHVRSFDLSAQARAATAEVTFFVAGFGSQSGT